MKVLGLNISGYISSAALVEDGTVLAATAEERFSRQKRDRSFPKRSIQYALETAGIRAEELDEVAIAWNPSRHLARGYDLQAESNATRAKYLSYVPKGLVAALGLEPRPETSQELSGLRVRYVDHHLAHAASSAFTSPWSRAAVVSVDAFGEENSLAISRLADGVITVLETVAFPHSVGSFYSYICEFLGFQADADEYKVMALGAFADPVQTAALHPRVEGLYRIGGAGGADSSLGFELDLNRFDHYDFQRAHNFAPMEAALGMPARGADAPIGPEHYALAAALQLSFERIIDTILRHARALTGETVAALSGGCFMNSLANGKLELPSADGRAPAFDAVHVTGWPDDSGTAIGAALYAAVNGRGKAFAELRHSFFGPTILAKDVTESVARRKLVALARPAPDPARAVATAVASGAIVGYAAGRMEFGQRALGHRSIFADPRDPLIRDKVNAHVKRREAFRPYALSILAERIHEVFDAPAGYESWVMEKVRPVRAAWAERIKGVLHADGSVRLHTITEETNPELHAILLAFEGLTGMPLILNTSFNIAGMPMVCSADDAIDCFMQCGLDALVLGEHILWKPDSDGPT